MTRKKKKFGSMCFPCRAKEQRREDKELGNDSLVFVSREFFSPPDIGEIGRNWDKAADSVKLPLKVL